jgi:hypothetical protein
LLPLRHVGFAPKENTPLSLSVGVFEDPGEGLKTANKNLLLLARNEPRYYSLLACNLFDLSNKISGSIELVQQ